MSISVYLSETQCRLSLIQPCTLCILYMADYFFTSALPLETLQCFHHKPKKEINFKKKNTPWIYFTLTRWSITPHSADRWVKFKINTCRLPLISSATLFTPTHKHKGKRKRHSPTPLHTSRRRRGCDLSLSGRNTCVWWETLYDSLSQGTPGCPPLE